MKKMYLTSDDLDCLATALTMLDLIYTVFEDTKNELSPLSPAYKPLSNAMMSINRASLMVQHQACKYNDSLTNDVHNYFN